MFPPGPNPLDAYWLNHLTHSLRRVKADLNPTGQTKAKQHDAKPLDLSLKEGETISINIGHVSVFCGSAVWYLIFFFSDFKQGFLKTFNFNLI